MQEIAEKRMEMVSADPFNEVEQVILKRRSVRIYKKKQVPDNILRRILEAGRFAPSAGNSQPWKFIVVQDPVMIREMTEDVVRTCSLLMKIADYISPGGMWKRPIAKLLQFFRPHDLHPIPFGAMRLIAEGKLGVWHGAPTIIVILADKRAPGNPMIDVGIAGQNIVLSAHSHGLGTCWVSFIKPLSYTWKWRKRLGIKYPYKLATSIAIGYPNGEPDGYVSRETRLVEWYREDGFRRIES